MLSFFFFLHRGIICILIELAKYFVKQKNFLVKIIMLLVQMTFFLDKKILITFSINEKLINVVGWIIKEEITELIMLHVIADYWEFID